MAECGLCEVTSGHACCRLAFMEVLINREAGRVVSKGGGMTQRAVHAQCMIKCGLSPLHCVDNGKHALWGERVFVV